MNDFIEQFLIEAHELIEAATADLLALEANPADAPRLDGAFRAFHTLKGAAGIIEFEDMSRGLHVVEEALAAVRSGRAAMNPQLVGDCLSALDQVLDWLEMIQATGEAPGDAAHAADVLISRFAAHDDASRPRPDTRAPSREWLPGLLARELGDGQPQTAFHYAPAPGAFFEGEDPLAAITAAPGLLAVDISPTGPWPPLAEFDPFTCAITISGLSTASSSEVGAALDALPCLELVDLGATHALGGAARALVEAQIAMLADADPTGLGGRLSSAGRTAVAALRQTGLAASADSVEAATSRAGNTNDPRPLVEALQGVLRGEVSQPRAAAGPGAGGLESRSLRVDVERIDALVRLAGELQVSKNAFSHLSTLAQEGRNIVALAEGLKEQQGILERLVADLQRSVVAIRVLPLRHVFQRFPRLVREIGQSTGKQVRLVVEGEDTEADKTVVETLFEPLLHVLRNAVDHGVEVPAERRRLGKSETAVIRLAAARRGENVEIEITDDGHGVDLARVREAVLAQGLRDPQTLTAMSDDEVIQLIFAPGFSTTATVTEISGRGVGMDAVRVAVERLGGQVTVQSRPERGTSIRFMLPFSVMMTRVMTVLAGGQAFGIPLDAVLETVRIPREAIARIGAAHAFVLRDRTIPLFHLGGTLQGTDPARAEGEATVVVVSAAGQPAGLEVDRVGERMDVMLKPMEGLLSGAFAAAGTTLLGDGRVLIVLDVEELLA